MKKNNRKFGEPLCPRLYQHFANAIFYGYPEKRITRLPNKANIGYKLSFVIGNKQDLTNKIPETRRVLVR